MDTSAFDRLTQSLSTAETRRSALGTLLGAFLLGTTLGAAAAKSKHRRQGKRRGETKQRANRSISAQAKTANQCLDPTGVDVNAFLGISAQIVAKNPPNPPFFEGCDEVGSGERWTVAQRWFVKDTSFAAGPPVHPDFVPDGATPLEDFNAKFSAVKYVIDPGAKKKKTVVVSNSDDLFTFDLGSDILLLSPTTLGTIKPQSVGKHVVEVYWVLNGMHCDGFGAVLDPNNPVASNCIPAGEVLFSRVAFEVTPGHH